MSATIKLEKHFPVLLNELISIISPLYGGTFIDCTFGQGGYSKKILENKKNKVIAIDRDEQAILEANKLIKKYGNRFRFENINFTNINKINLEQDEIKGIIFDLGYSTVQIKDSKKGLSFNNLGKLNMRIGINNFSAHDVISKMSYESIYKIFKYFGEEKKAKIIAKRIIFNRERKIIQTQDLVEIIQNIKKTKQNKIHNSTKIFQSLRIFVNKEITSLIYGLINSFKILPIGGVLAVVTFNSIEDKIVKFFFKNYSEKKQNSRYIPEKKNDKILFQLINKKPILPSVKEIQKNFPSRSAKLRCVKKIDNSYNFDEFINKFQKLIEIENLSTEL